MPDSSYLMQIKECLNEVGRQVKQWIDKKGVWRDSIIDPDQTHKY